MTDNGSNNTSTSGGLGFTGALFIVFLVLKLTGVIDWSWWWVTAPLWAGVALLLAFGVFGLLFLLGLKAWNRLHGRKPAPKGKRRA